VPWANAADLFADYLYGRWVIDEQNCSSPDAEYIEFNKKCIGNFTSCSGSAPPLAVEVTRLRRAASLIEKET
jgi:hypothetical protein